MKIDNILLDLDGTIIDSFPGIEHSVKMALAAIIPQREIPCLRSLIGPSIRQIFQQALVEVDQEVLEQLEHQFRSSYDSNGWQKTVAYQGVLETLFQLDKLNIKIFVVTNKPITPTKRILERLQLLNYIKDVFSPDSKSPAFKSKTEAVAYAIAKYQLDIHKTILVGDSKDDAQAATLSGIKFFAVSYGYGKAHLEREFPINQVLSEFSHLLNNLIISPNCHN